MPLFGSSAGWLQPSAEHTYGFSRLFRRRQQGIALLIGLLVFVIPTGSIWLNDLDGCLRDSISHLYYDRFGSDLLVGGLMLAAGLLVGYRGENRIENLLAGCVAAAIAGVALIPTTGSGCDAIGAGLTARPVVSFEPLDIFETGGEDLIPPTGEAILNYAFEIYPSIPGWVHYGAAGVVFALLLVHCWVIFPRVIPERHLMGGALVPAKRRRNRIYALSGLVIAIAGAVMIAGAVLGLDATDLWDAWNVTYWAEAAGLWAFAVSWAVKGKVAGALEDPA